MSKKTGITKSRVVAFLTPVFAGASAWFVPWAATNLPGAPKLDAGEMTALAVAGCGAGAGAAVKWLHGLSQHERQAADTAANVARDEAFARADLARGALLDPAEGVPQPDSIAKLHLALGAALERLDKLEEAPPVRAVPIRAAAAKRAAPVSVPVAKKSAVRSPRIRKR